MGGLQHSAGRGAGATARTKDTASSASAAALVQAALVQAATASAAAKATEEATPAGGLQRPGQPARRQPWPRSSASAWPRPKASASSSASASGSIAAHPAPCFAPKAAPLQSLQQAASAGPRSGQGAAKRSATCQASRIFGKIYEFFTKFWPRLGFAAQKGAATGCALGARQRAQAVPWQLGAHSPRRH